MEAVFEWYLEKDALSSGNLIFLVCCLRVIFSVCDCAGWGGARWQGGRGK